MPRVHCGLRCFDLPGVLRAEDVAAEFSSSLNSALDGAGGGVDVYRLEPLAPHVQLSDNDMVVCCVPEWQFDLDAVEDLHRQLEDLRIQHERLLCQYSRTKEALKDVSNASAAEAVEVEAPLASRRGAAGSRKSEVDQLKLMLSHEQKLNEKKQQETKATVMALRNEFMQLVNMMTDAGGARQFDIPSVMKEIDTNTTDSWPQADQVSGAGYSLEATKSRHVSQPPMVPGARRPSGSPRVYRTPGNFTTPRIVTRPRGTQQRRDYSAGASSRQRQTRDGY